MNRRSFLRSCAAAVVLSVAPSLPLGQLDAQIIKPSADWTISWRLYDDYRFLKTYYDNRGEMAGPCFEGKEEGVNFYALKGPEAYWACNTNLMSRVAEHLTPIVSSRSIPIKDSY